MKSNSTHRLIRLLSLLLLVFTLNAHSNVKLPKIISNGMVLQREAKVNIWGWADIGEKISLHFIDSTYTAVADEIGNWNIVLHNLKAGGPYDMQINAINEIIVTDILIGDVWVCSGQSNMEYPMNRLTSIYEKEIAGCENQFIRHFEVPDKYDFNTPQTDLKSGNWETTNPTSILKFSAVAYFFANEIYKKYHVPIGLINASMGGLPAEALMSEEALIEFPELYKEAQKFKDSTLIVQIEKSDKERSDNWYKLLRINDDGYKNPSKPWYSADKNTSEWSEMYVPGYWADGTLGETNGVVWFRKEITVPASMTGKSAQIILGRIVDADSVFINGKFIGTTSYQYPRRRYNIPSDLLVEGKNSIVIRVISNIGKGGFVLDKPYEIVCNGLTIDLKGSWQYRPGAKMDPLEGQTFVRWKPTGLFNGMISPLFNYRIKGVLWYQGESNADRPVEYRTLLPTLINDWRNHWNQGSFPFLIVQLPNFMEPKSQPGESNWAMLRESQQKSLIMPNTGLVVAIDLGEWNDIHPVNKKEVGVRLALAAEKVAYKENEIVYSGPVFQSMKIEGNKAILYFGSSGSGLMAKNTAELRYFTIAGADKQFVWAKAKIEGNKVIVWSDEINSPVAVRYAWADNPVGANLYNKEGLPASPFRTDSW